MHLNFHDDDMDIILCPDESTSEREDNDSCASSGEIESTSHESYYCGSDSTSDTSDAESIISESDTDFTRVLSSNKSTDEALALFPGSPVGSHEFIITFMQLCQRHMPAKRIC